MSEKVLTIQRSKWLRGGNSDVVLLRDEIGRMCCLGFDALACGFSANDITGMSSPSPLIAKCDWAPDGYDLRADHRHNSAATIRAIDINDDPNLTDAAREAQLADVLKMFGYDRVEFVD